MARASSSFARSDGVVMRLPRAWTDADGVTVTDAGPDAMFTVDAIRALVELVEALRGRDR
jgi:hypothetical protein